MKTYEVEWLRGANQDLPRVKKYFIEGDDAHDAFAKAAGKHNHPAYPEIFIRWDDGNECFDNPHFDPALNPQYVKRSREQVGAARKPTEVKIGNQRKTGKVKTGGVVESQFKPPQSSGWATLYRVCGGISFFFGIIGTIVVAQKNEEAAFHLAVMAIGLSLTCFLFAFLIDVPTDMREHLRRMAEKQ